MDPGECRLRCSGSHVFALLCGHILLEFGPLGKLGDLLGNRLRQGDDAVGLLDESIELVEIGPGTALVFLCLYRIRRQVCC